MLCCCQSERVYCKLAVPASVARWYLFIPNWYYLAPTWYFGDLSEDTRYLFFQIWYLFGICVPPFFFLFIFNQQVIYLRCANLIINNTI